MRQLSRWLTLFVLLVSTASLARPAYAVVSITLSWTTINAPMGGVVTNVVTVKNTDLVAHTITLSLAGGGGWWWGTFAPNPITVPGGGGSATSTLTIPVPGPGDLCPGESSPGAYYLSFTVQGREGGAVLASASLAVYVLPIAVPLTVSVEPSKSSYRIGETVTLRMNSNLPAEYYLNVRKPDGSTWASAHAYLPATFTKEATEPLGTYTAELVAYYCGIAQASASFSVTPNTYDVTISLAGLPTAVATTLRVDGNKVADMKGGDVKVLTYPIGTSHRFEVDQYVSGAEGYRYYCASNSWTASAAGSNMFNYATQVKLDVSTEPAGVTDVTASGWFAAGSSASISQVPAEVQGTTKGTKYVFTGWTVDGTPRAGNGFVVIMDAPHKAVAKFDTMFMLTILSDYGNPKGAGYYRSGETATFSVDSPVGFGIQQVFVEWKGDYSGRDPKGSLTIDGPKTVTTVWTTSYLQVYLIAGAAVAIVLLVIILLWRRSRPGPSAVKPPPPPAEAAQTPAEPSPPAPVTETAPKRAVSIALRCTNCGHELKRGQVYCPECGQKQSD